MEETRLFIEKELKLRYPEATLVDDGILVPEIFKKQEKKVLFLLKETFGDYNQIKGTQDIYNGKSSPFWTNFFNWTNAVNNSGLSFLEKNRISEITKTIDNVAYINIKKLNENRKKSVYNDIISYARKDKDLLEFQIESINPDIIFVSQTTLDAYKIIYGYDKLILIDFIECGKVTFKLYKHGCRKIIKTFHPSAFPVKQAKAFKALKQLHDRNS
ncbi:hypothetical protein [Zunongwangia endophytica]|uniref:Uracil DNA glycosylase superfamily protein n=1 Tax=Zunongwangia endophytica TaxID=1808945 RepID=A0ABV8HDG1_9FLAO|nr:hypothetical protein [Zunongwangia endophytica]MDN3594653.1 hypothetical protein [Zunongwangia endophytica]